MDLRLAKALQGRMRVRGRNPGRRRTIAVGVVRVAVPLPVVRRVERPA